jgi:leader peptidase (prepilin peptidase)/N-methyltransferase
MIYLLTILYGLAGLAVGSFLNVVIDRVPAGGSILRPASHCPECERKLTPAELIPVVSHIWLRGKCRTCGARIPARSLWVELSTGLLFAWLFWRYGFGPRTLLNTLYVCILIVVFFIDLEHKLVLNVIILPATLVALFLVPLHALVQTPSYARQGMLGLILGGRAFWTPFWLDVLSALLGGLSSFLLFLVIWLLAPRGMGAGDVKLAAFTGLITGFPGAIAAALGSFILGGVVAVVLLLGQRVGRKTAIPFAPFLVIATLVIILYGDPIVRWYLVR